eukprot:4726150-Prorocentrum_lima.AAC.1
MAASLAKRSLQYHGGLHDIEGFDPLPNARNSEPWSVHCPPWVSKASNDVVTVHAWLCSGAYGLSSMFWQRPNSRLS